MPNANAHTTLTPVRDAAMRGATARLLCATIAMHVLVAIAAPGDRRYFLHDNPAFVPIRSPSLLGLGRGTRTDQSETGSGRISRPPSCLSLSSQSSGDDRNTTRNEVVRDSDALLDGLSWRVAKARLEEAHTQRFLKRKPYKLPYATSQRWIQRNWAPKTRQEFEELVENGNLRTPYISKRPEEYYGARGEWISWEHYLLGECSEGDEGSAGERNGTEVWKWQ